MDDRLKTLETDFSRLETKIDAIMEMLTRIENFLHQTTPPRLESISQTTDPVTTPTSKQVPGATFGRLPSSSIDKTNLQHPVLIIKNNSHLAGKEGKVGTMALLLA